MTAGLWALVTAFAWVQLACQNTRSSDIVGDVPLFDTTAWRTEGDLFIRSSGEDPEDLLLMHRKAKEVYRWDPNDESLQWNVPYEDWEQATGPIDYYEALPASPLNLREHLEGYRSLSDAGWMVRSEGHDKDTLLLTHLKLEMVYRYDQATRELALLPHEHWEASSEEIVECPTLDSPSGLRIESRRTPSDPRLDRLLAGDRVIRTAGARALTMSESPSGRFASVLSADGERRESLMPFSGPGGADGQHFHELLSLTDFTRVGVPVRLPMTTKEIISLDSCWSPDERYVVYSDFSSFRLLSVVPID
jgi:hypothetical protein